MDIKTERSKQKLKKNIETAIDNIINIAIVKNPDLEEDYNKIISILETAKTDLENNIYFNIEEDILNITNAYYNDPASECKLYENVREIIINSDVYHKVIMQNFVKSQFEKVSYKFNKSKFISIISFQKDLLEELVNYIINNNSFLKNRKPIITNGNTTEEILELNGDILSVYKHIMETRKVW